MISIKTTLRKNRIQKKLKCYSISTFFVPTIRILSVYNKVYSTWQQVLVSLDRQLYKPHWSPVYNISNNIVLFDNVIY